MAFSSDPDTAVSGNSHPPHVPTPSVQHRTWLEYVCSSPAMLEVMELCAAFANQPGAILLLGPTGAGKERVTSEIVQLSDRCEKPFQAINCAGIPEALLESEMFGHEKGAFTGAERRRLGLFEMLDGGTIMLDEIGDMPNATQAKMLRVIESGRFSRVGGNELISTDVRIISATNQDLEEMCKRKTFRLDLYYRISTYPILIPPLVRRPEDLALLIKQLAESSAVPVQLADEANEKLLNYEWPGNIRELINVMRRAIALACYQNRNTGGVATVLPKHITFTVGKA